MEEQPFATIPKRARQHGQHDRRDRQELGLHTPYWRRVGQARAVGGSSASTRPTRANLAGSMPTTAGFIISSKDLAAGASHRLNLLSLHAPGRHTARGTAPRRSPNVRDEARIVGSPASTKPTRRKVAAEAVVTERRWISMAGQSNTLIQMHRMADQSNTRVTGARRQTNSADASLHPGLPLDGLGGDL